MATQRPSGAPNDLPPSAARPVLSAAPPMGLKFQQEHLRGQKPLEEPLKSFDAPPAADLVRLIRFMESELQARDVAIAVLKAEKIKYTLYQAKYSRFGLSDPFHALQRDSDHVSHDSFDENAVRAMFDSQLAQLENLIATQRKAQLKMREQLVLAEKRYNKVCLELDEEKQKHAQDTANGDDITVALEKDREHLKQELEFECAKNKKLEKELRKALQQIEEQQLVMERHKKVSVALIKERRKMLAKVLEAERHNELIAQQLQQEKEDGAKQECSKLMQMEAKMERQLSEFDIEREQMKARLRREETRATDLAVQVDLLRQQLLSQQQHSTQASSQLGAQSDDRFAASGGGGAVASGAVLTAGTADLPAQQLRHCIVDMGGGSSDRLPPSPSTQIELPSSPALQRPAVAAVRASPVLPEWMLARAAARAGAAPPHSSSSAVSASPPAIRTSPAFRVASDPSPVAETFAGSPLLPAGFGVSPVDTSEAAASAVSPVVAPVSAPLLVHSASETTSAVASGRPPSTLLCSSPKTSSCDSAGGGRPASTVVVANSIKTLSPEGGVPPPTPAGSSSGSNRAADSGAAASAAALKVTAKTSLPLPLLRKPATAVAVTSTARVAPPPVPPNKPQIALAKPAPSTAAALPSAQDSSATSPLPAFSGTAVVGLTPSIAAGGTGVASVAAETTVKQLSGTDSVPVVTRVALTPPSPSTSAKQRPPPPQRIVSLQKSLVTASSSTSSTGSIGMGGGSSGSSLASTLAAVKIDTEHAEGIK